MTIKEIFAGESDNLEFKEEIPTKSEKFMKTVVAFANGRIVGKWNLLYTPYRFDGGYGEELSGERWKRGAFFGVLLVMGVLLFYGRKKMEE